jgi:hypothetical protein
MDILEKGALMYFQAIVGDCVVGFGGHRTDGGGLDEATAKSAQNTLWKAQHRLDHLSSRNE